jgi:hypothetical protein
MQEKEKEVKLKGDSRKRMMIEEKFFCPGDVIYACAKCHAQVTVFILYNQKVTVNLILKSIMLMQ